LKVPAGDVGQGGKVSRLDYGDWRDDAVYSNTSPKQDRERRRAIERAHAEEEARRADPEVMAARAAEAEADAKALAVRLHAHNTLKYGEDVAEELAEIDRSIRDLRARRAALPPLGPEYRVLETQICALTSRYRAIVWPSAEGEGQ